MRWNPFRKDPDPFSATRYSDMFRGVRTRQRKHMRKRWQWYLLAVVVLWGSVIGFGVYRYYKLQGDIHVPGFKGQEVAENEPFNVLLVGSDSRAGLTEEEQFDLGAAAVGGERADTLILAHIDPDSDQIIMVQFPRDLWVDVGDSEGKINEALIEGPKHLATVVEDLTGLPINKYVQVNIAGFRDVVDAIGGVDICIPEPIPFDSQTGIEVAADEVGMVHFDGDRAIRFVRSRKVFPGGDFDRIANQQKFLSAAVRKVTSVGTILNPGRILKLIDIAGENLKTDTSVTPIGVKRLLDRFKSFDPEHYEAYTAPNFGTGRVGEASVVLPDFETMEVMFDAIGDDRSPAEVTDVPDIAPNTIRMGFYNGTFQEGVALEASEAVKEATSVPGGPIEVADIANADDFDYRRSIIVYNEDEPEAERMAELVSAALPDLEVEAGKTDSGIDVALIVGKKKFETQPIVQILPIPLPKPGELPKVCREDS